MKTLFPTLLGLVLLLSGVAHAGPRAFDGAGRLLTLKEKANLTPEQTAQVKNVFLSHAQARREAHAQVQAAQETLASLAAANSQDENAYQKPLESLEQAHQKLLMLRQQELVQLKGILKPSQQARVVLSMHDRLNKMNDL